MGRRDQYGDPEEYEDDFFRQPMPPELKVALLIGAVLMGLTAIVLAWRLTVVR